MSWETWLGIIGIIATLAVGYWGILEARSKRYPGELTMYRRGTIRLFADITANIPQIAITYNGKAATKNMSLLRAYIVNTGKKDITKEMVERPLTITLEKGYRWLEASGKASYDNNEHAQLLSEREVEFSLGMLRKNDFIRFEGLMEFDDGRSWGGKLSIDHRIADTSKVKWADLPAEVGKLTLPDYVYGGLCIPLVGAMLWVAAISNSKETRLVLALNPVILVTTLCVFFWKRKCNRQLQNLLRVEQGRGDL